METSPLIHRANQQTGFELYDRDITHERVKRQHHKMVKTKFSSNKTTTMIFFSIFFLFFFFAIVQLLQIVGALIVITNRGSFCY